MLPYFEFMVALNLISEYFHIVNAQAGVFRSWGADGML